MNVHQHHLHVNKSVLIIQGVMSATVGMDIDLLVTTDFVMVQYVIHYVKHTID